MDDQRPRGRARGRVRVQPAPGEEGSGSDNGNGNGDRSSRSGEGLAAGWRAQAGSGESGAGGGGSPESSSSSGDEQREGGSGRGRGEDPRNIGRRGERSGFELQELVTTRRPGFSKQGETGTVRKYFANYFQMRNKMPPQLRLYSVSFSPVLDSVGKRRAILRQREEVLGPFMFDGTLLIALNPIPDGALNLDVQLENDNVQYNVQIYFKREILPEEPMMIQVYNIAIRKAMDLLKLTRIRRNLFDGQQMLTMRQWNLNVWPGFMTSMRQMERELMLNVDTTFKVCRIDTVLDILKHHREQGEGIAERYQPAAEEAINGSIVMTGYNNNTFRVDGIEWGRRPTDTFTQTRGGRTREVSFVDYFREKYNVEIRVLAQPLLRSDPTKQDTRRGMDQPKLLVPELCHQTGLTDEMRNNRNLMKSLAENFHSEPYQRLLRCVSFVRRMTRDAQITAELLRWNLELRDEPVEVPGRELPKEEIVMQQAVFKPDDKGDWTSSCRDKKMHSLRPFRVWIVIYSRRDADGLDNFLRTLHQVSGPLGFLPPAPERIQIDGSVRGFEEAIRNSVAKYKDGLGLIVCVLPNPRLETYARIKVLCSHEYGIPSQCLLAKTSKSRGLMAVCTKLVIQMNAKLGGEPWALKCPLKGLMVVGFDVFHQRNKQSYGAMTATTTSTLAEYYSITNRMGSGMEMSTSIGASLGRCLEGFRRVNQGSLPSRVMMYRDGVGEGQLNYVILTELAAIKGILEHVYEEAGVEKPKLTLVIVTKRINTKIFLRTGPNPNDLANPRPGTIVDDVITCPEKYDFFMVPQVARQGTVSPVSYNVIHDESGLDADKMQRFTYRLCHGYFNWSGTVSVPAPCQYAHKLAFLTGTALGRPVHANLLNKLHFL